MSAHKHTPGEWMTCDPHGPVVGGTSVQASGDNYMIASCCHYYPREQVQANARLIAAAPELLHVAHMVYDAEMDWRSEGHQSIPDSALATIRAAIAKATGEQP